MGLATSSILGKRPTNLKGKAFADARNLAPPKPGCKSTGAVCISKRINANLKGKAIATPNNRATTKTKRKTTDIGKRNKYKNTGKLPALASSGVEISYRSLGGPTYACPNCNATIWIDHSLNKGRGLYTFRINGQHYHRIRSLLPTAGTQPRSRIILTKGSERLPGIMSQSKSIMHTSFNTEKISRQLCIEVEGTLRIDLYHNVVDAITKGDTDAAGQVVYGIEFQKQGLPHTYILLWIEEYYRCKATTDIDDIILAELSSPTNDPIGYKAVSDYMLHGPGGKDNRAANQKHVTLHDTDCLSALLQKEGPLRILLEQSITAIKGYRGGSGG
nr:hypothetical protein [Tanacetum cinerariifolium]